MYQCVVGEVFHGFPGRRDPNESTVSAPGLALLVSYLLSDLPIRSSVCVSYFFLQFLPHLPTRNDQMSGNPIPVRFTNYSDFTSGPTIPVEDPGVSDFRSIVSFLRLACHRFPIFATNSMFG